MKFPVMFYVHGGAFVSLSGKDMKPEYFMDEDVILVTVNYRLGPLGFLSTGDKSIRGNMGLKDQVLALKWVKENIEYFGGDSNKITIIGESAGAVSIHLLMLSETTRGLYHKAIALSGSALASWAFTKPQKAKETTQSFAKQFNCPTEDGQALVDCLRQLDVGDILGAFRKDVENDPLIFPTRRGKMFPPTVEIVKDEEAFLTVHPYDLLVQRKVSQVPFMTGVLKDEGLLASLEFKRDDNAQNYFLDNWYDCIEHSLYLSTLPEDTRREFSDKLADFYLKKGMNDEETFSGLNNMLSDGLFIVGTAESVAVQRKYSSENIYLFYYNKTGGPTLANILGEMKTRYHMVVEGIIFAGKTFYNQFILGLPAQNYGVMHADDVQMMFPIVKYVMEIPKNDNDPNYKFSKDFVQMLVSFARDEKSVAFRGMRLPVVTKNGPLKYIVLNDEPPIIIEDLFAERMKLWHSLNYTQLFASNKI